MLKQTGTGGSGEASLLQQKKPPKQIKCSHFTLVILYTETAKVTCVNSDVFNEPSCASGSIIAVATLQLPIIGPLKTIDKDSRTVLQGDVHRGVIQSILTAVCNTIIKNNIGRI